MKRDDQKCNGAHTWTQVGSWLDTGLCRWIEQACQKCGLKKRERV